MTQRDWRIPISAKLFQNLDDTAISAATTRLENAYGTEAKGLSRFPQLSDFLSLTGNAPVYLEEWRGDLIAVSGGRTYRVDVNNVKARDVTGAAVTGSGRVIFAKTDDDLLMAAGRQIIRLSKNETSILSNEAPESTHVGYVSGFVVAIEPRSGRFRYTPAGEYTVWKDLDVLSAEGKPDDLVALIISEFGELLLAGTESIEQFDPAPSGVVPFFRRWVLGSGISAPYTLLSIGSRLWGVNEDREFVSFSTQTPTSVSSDIQAVLERVRDWSDAWTQELRISGQKFIVLQIPNAENIYGTKGITYLYDYQQRQWSNLYGWDEAQAAPARWPGWSVKEIGGRVFVGGNGKIYELGGFDGNVEQQQMLWRSGHLDVTGSKQVRIEKVVLRAKRGYAKTGDKPAIISLRVNRDNTGFGPWIRRTLGGAGQNEMKILFPALGIASQWQFELAVMDNTQVEIGRMDAIVTELR